MLVDLFTFWTSENLLFGVMATGSQPMLSRIAQEIEIILSPVMLVEQDLSIFPLHN